MTPLLTLPEAAPLTVTITQELYDVLWAARELRKSGYTMATARKLRLDAQYAMHGSQALARWLDAATDCALYNAERAGMSPSPPPVPAGETDIWNQGINQRTEGFAADEIARLRAALAGALADVAGLRQEEAAHLAAMRSEEERHDRLIAEAEREIAKLTHMLTGGGSAAYLGELAEAKARAERAEADLAASREAQIMLQGALLTQSALLKRVEADLAGAREVIEKP